MPGNMEVCDGNPLSPCVAPACCRSISPSRLGADLSARTEFQEHNPDSQPRDNSINQLPKGAKHVIPRCLGQIYAEKAECRLEEPTTKGFIAGSNATPMNPKALSNGRRSRFTSKSSDLLTVVMVTRCKIPTSPSLQQGAKCCRHGCKLGLGCFQWQMPASNSHICVAGVLFETFRQVAFQRRQRHLFIGCSV